MSAQNIEPVYLTEEGVAELLNIEVKTVRWWRHRHIGPPCYGTHRFLRYEKSEVIAWFATMRRKSRKEKAAEAAAAEAANAA